MDVVAEVRAVVVRFRRAASQHTARSGGQWESDPGRPAGLLRRLTRTCHGGGWFTPTAHRRRVMKAEPERCSKRKEFLSATASSTWPRSGPSAPTDPDGQVRHDKAIPCRRREQCHQRQQGWQTVYTASASAKIAVIEQAPELRAQTSGATWDDAHEKTLIDWLGSLRSSSEISTCSIRSG